MEVLISNKFTIGHSKYMFVSSTRIHIPGGTDRDFVKLPTDLVKLPTDLVKLPKDDFIGK